MPPRLPASGSGKDQLAWVRSFRRRDIRSCPPAPPPKTSSSAAMGRTTSSAGRTLRRPPDPGHRPPPRPTAALLRSGRGHAAGACVARQVRPQAVGDRSADDRPRPDDQRDAGLHVPDEPLGAGEQGVPVRLQSRRVHGPGAGRHAAPDRPAAARQREPVALCEALLQVGVREEPRNAAEEVSHLR